MKNFNNNSQLVSSQIDAQRFRNKLAGLQAITGTTHWQHGSAANTNTVNEYVEYGNRLRSHAFIAAIGQFAGLIFTRSAQIGKTYKNWSVRRKDAHQLSSLNEQTLNDIGLTREDVYEFGVGRLSADDLIARRAEVCNQYLAAIKPRLLPKQQSAVPAANDECFEHAA